MVGEKTKYTPTHTHLFGNIFKNGIFFCRYQNTHFECVYKHCIQYALDMIIVIEKNKKIIYLIKNIVRFSTPTHPKCILKYSLII